MRWKDRLEVLTISIVDALSIVTIIFVLNHWMLRPGIEHYLYATYRSPGPTFNYVYYLLGRDLQIFPAAWISFLGLCLWRSRKHLPYPFPFRILLLLSALIAIPFTFIWSGHHWLDMLDLPFWPKCILAYGWMLIGTVTWTLESRKRAQ